MAYHKRILFVIVLLMAHLSVAQHNKFNFEQAYRTAGNVCFAVPNSDENLLAVKQSSASIKNKTNDWVFISCSAYTIDSLYKTKAITDFYFEYAPPSLLDDSSRLLHQVNPVHAGQNGIPIGFTGQNVIVGIVDSGLDHNHPDFIDTNGNKRLLRYWDHSITNGNNVPQPYGYGQLWTQNDIISGTITSNETGTAHGTTVSGMAVGNGLANGKNKGFAPDANIVVVKTNFSLPNWTLTIADACDYIFRVADSLNMPAVVNLSLGSYLGSHDGTDPASQLINNLLDEKGGRIVVCAAGNSGNGGNYHVRNDFLTDTSFVWFENKASGALGQNFVFFDLWSDQNQVNYSYSFSAIDPSNYTKRASTIFYNPFDFIGSPLFDTLRNTNNEILATLEVYHNLVGNNLQIQAYFDKVDSTAYYYSFETTGSGRYDLWSGEFLNLNKIVEDLPDASIVPNIYKYVLPDSLQSIVSSWNCSEKVVSVGNLRGRLGHIDKNGNQYYPAEMTLPGRLVLSSSKGPTRHDVIKPDVTATGDVTMAAAPAWLLNNPAFNSVIDVDGLHARNGGTSMASPVVAGTAALFLEKCTNGDWQSFKNLLFLSSETDTDTGNTPNNAYGYGKMNALSLMTEALLPLNIIGDTLICQAPVLVGSAPPLVNYNWSNGETSSEITIANSLQLSLYGKDQQGCLRFSDTLTIMEGNAPASPIITLVGNGLLTTFGPNIQWYFNDALLPGETAQMLFPELNGFYSVSFTSEDGCTVFSNAFEYTLSISQLSIENIQLYPNPAENKVTLVFPVSGNYNIYITDMTGNVVKAHRVVGDRTELNIAELAKGTYFVHLHSQDFANVVKFIRK
jgi:subtilisin family serine protease